MDLQLMEKPVVVTEPLRDRVASLGDQAEAIAAYVRELTRNVVEIPPTSRSFVGFIRDYRYTVGRKGEMPSHRFYVECDGGVWLYSRNEAAAFEQMMQDMDDGENGLGDVSAATLNGRMVVCNAMPETNSVVPVAFVEQIGLNDRFGNRLFVGAPVTAYVNNTRIRCQVAGENGDGTLTIGLVDGSTAVVEANEVTRTF